MRAPVDRHNNNMLGRWTHWQADGCGSVNHPPWSRMYSDRNAASWGQAGRYPLIGWYLVRRHLGNESGGIIDSKLGAEGVVERGTGDAETSR